MSKIYYDKRRKYFTSFRPSQKDIINKIYGINCERQSIVAMLFDIRTSYFPRWAWSNSLLFVCYLILSFGIVMGFLYPEPILFTIPIITMFFFLKRARIVDVILHSSVLGLITALTSLEIGIISLLIVLLARYQKDSIIQEKTKQWRGVHDVMDIIHRVAKTYPMRKTKTLEISLLAMRKKFDTPFDMALSSYLAGIDEAKEVDNIEKEDVIEFLLPIFKGEEND